MAGRRPPSGHPRLGHVEVEEPLAEQRGGPAANRLGGVAMAVGVWPRARSRRGSPPHLAAVELDRTHLGGRRVAADLDHVDVGEQRGHLHGEWSGGSGRGGRSGRARPGPTYGPSVVAPAGTEMVPVPPTAELEAEVVAAAVVGMP